MPPAIRVDGLSKTYRIGVRRGQRAGSLVELAGTALRAPGRWLRGRRAAAVPQKKQEPADTIWALKNVSFEVQPGEVVGIIGRNGAGKSTLLKILSRITEPTSGCAEIHGRIASLLEVGTGFHPELTGRENVYLNGAILGMTRREIDRKFDEIVAFSGVEKFLDTPVKRYSSGMYTRLTFSVAAHLESEILLVDEVLAVGDASFQKKCIGKMQDVSSRQGKTVLFISHNLSAVTRFCQRAILLEAGQIRADGPCLEVTSTYFGSDNEMRATREWPDVTTAPGNEIVRLKGVRVKDRHGRVSRVIDIRDPVQVELEFQVLTGGHVLWPCFSFQNNEGICAFAVYDHDPTWLRRPRPPGTFASTATIPGNFLAEGQLLVGAGLCTFVPNIILHVHEPDAVAFEVVDPGTGDSAQGDATSCRVPGVVRPLLDWTTRFTPELPSSISMHLNPSQSSR